MEKVLVKLHTNYADEFDVNCVWITTKEEYEKWLEALKTQFNPNREYYFGTNEYVTFDSLDELLDSLKVINISNDFYTNFFAYLGENFGLLNLKWFVK